MYQISKLSGLIETTSKLDKKRNLGARTRLRSFSKSFRISDLEHKRNLRAKIQVHTLSLDRGIAMNE